MFCTKCGKELSNNDLFCDNCGTKATNQCDSTNQQTANTAHKRFFTKSKVFLLFLLVVIFIGSILFLNFRSNSLKVVAKNHLESYIINNFEPILKYSPFDMEKILDDNYDRWLLNNSGHMEEWERKYGENLKCNVVITDIEELELNDYEDALDSFLKIAKHYNYALNVNKNAVTKIAKVSYDFTVSGDKSGFSGKFHSQFYKIDGKWYSLDLSCSTGNH